MAGDGLIDALTGRLTPEIVVAALLLLASLCFFAAALCVLGVLKQRLSPLQAQADRAEAPGRRMARRGPPARAGAAAGGRAAAPGTGNTAAKVSPERSAAADRAAPGTAGRDDAPAAAGGSSERDFEHEIALARQGVGVEQLMRECGLSQVEAGLLVRLYGTTAA